MEHEFDALGYLEKTYLDKDGAKHVTAEFSAKDAVEIAKLELMGRDLVNHRPVLLRFKVTMASAYESEKAEREGVFRTPGKKHRKKELVSRKTL